MGLLEPSLNFQVAYEGSHFSGLLQQILAGGRSGGGWDCVSPRKGRADQIHVLEGPWGSSLGYYKHGPHITRWPSASSSWRALRFPLAEFLPFKEMQAISSLLPEVKGIDAGVKRRMVWHLAAVWPWPPSWDTLASVSSRAKWKINNSMCPNSHNISKHEESNTIPIFQMRKL